MATVNWTIQKNVHDLEYQKLLAEYNLWASSSFVVTLTVMGFFYQILDINLSLLLLGGFVVYYLFDYKKTQAEAKLQMKLVRIKALSH